MQPIDYINRAAWASNPRQLRGRQIPEATSPTRTEFQRDRDRIIHSAAFRRLAHKTQVFVPHEGDHYRTRLTHTIEVGQIARALSRSLGLDEDLAETLALAHDLGHTPFGHTGEEVLDEIMSPWGGFDHNAQALRILTRLERRYAGFDGLNLLWETLEGLVKHNGPLLTPTGAPTQKYAARGVPVAILEFDGRFPLDLASHASAEAQAAAIADDIAYNAHDIDDGLRAGLFTLDELREVSFVNEIIREIETLHPNLEAPRFVNELIRRLITRSIEDVTTESLRRLRDAAPVDVAAIRAAPQTMIAFSGVMASADKAIKTWLFKHMYRHPRVMRIRVEAAAALHRLTQRLLETPEAMPGEWAAAAASITVSGEAEARRARLVCDYVAGMTDRYALTEHRRLLGDAPLLR